MPPNAFQKRLKRHVIGRHREYFAATAPGLEPLCRRELLAVCPAYADPQVIKGGVMFTGRLEDCMQANLMLRTANRVLMRVAAIRATHFAAMQSKVEQIAWELFLRPGTQLQVHVTTRHCRLHHTEAIAERLIGGIERRLGAADGPGQGAVQQLFVRGLDDRFGISLDSSGELLYRRGLKAHPARAPLRETTAAAALMLAGFDPAQPLLDPMCGSGTFALEAAMQMAGIPPGWFRSFAFTGWPAFRSERWRHVRQRHRPPPNIPEAGRILAADIDPGACRRLKQCVEQFELESIVRVTCRDFFDVLPASVGSRPGLLTLNPAYGRRLGAQAHGERFFDSICKKLQADFRYWKFALIAPHRQLLTKIPFRFKARRFFHGGLKVYLTYGRIQ